MTKPEDQLDEVHQYKKNDLGSFLYLLRFVKPYWFSVSGALGLIVLSVFSTVLSARFLGQLVEKGIAAKDWPRSRELGAIILTLELISIVSLYFGRVAMAYASSRSILAIRDRLFSHLNELPMRFFDKQPLGRTVTRITYDVEGLEDFFSGTLSRLLTAFLSLAMVIMSMLIINPKLGAILTASIIPAVFVTFAIRGSVRYWNREFAQKNSTINARLSEFLYGIGVIRSFGAEAWSQNIFDGVVDDHLHAAIKMNVLNAWSRPLIQLLCTAPLLVLLSWGGSQVFAGLLTIGVFVTFVRLCERFSRPISQLAQEIHTVQTAFTNAERITVFLNAQKEPDVLGADGTLLADDIVGEIDFKHLTMSYDGKQNVLSDISFHIPAGTQIGLAGRTGSGKTTTLGLLARLYEFQQGEILLDGKSIREYSRDSLRSQMGYVSQDVVIFKGSLRENLAFGQKFEDARILECCRKTGFLEIMRARNFDLEAELLDQGANLSHGERQLLALTRVLVKNPKLLILDEATANIDPDFERKIHQAVESVMKGRTCFIIAHRLGTLRNCEKILVFREGRLIEEGNHDELYTLGGYYAELVKMSEAQLYESREGMDA